MEASVNVPPAPAGKPIWKRPWFWVIAIPLAGFLFVVFLGLVATLLVPNVLQKYGIASRRKNEMDMIVIKNALTEYAVANGGKFPDSLQVLVTPDVNGRTYLDTTSVPKDPWGRTYIYEPPGPGSPQPRIRSYGRDGQPGGEGDDTDLDSALLGASK